jgi:hypothetical protein
MARWLGRAALAALAIALLGAAALFGGLGPLAMVPGGVLWGELRAPRSDWSFTDAVREIQVQTHVGPLPWSVTTWVLSEGGELFVAASDCDRVWTRRVTADPEVRIRIDGAIYELRARRENDPAVGARIAPVVLHKYLGIASDSARFVAGESRGCVFRLEPRS